MLQRLRNFPKIICCEVLGVFDEYKDVMSVEEACEALKMGKNSLYKLLKENTIRCIKVGRKYLIPKICLIDYVNLCRFS